MMKNNNFAQRYSNNNQARDTNYQRGENKDTGYQHYNQDRSRTHQFQQHHGQRDRSDQRDNRDRSTNRDRSGQRDRTGQFPDSSMGRESMNASNLGSVKFTPGYPTRELPHIDTKCDPSKKFTGRCRLFVGNLPHNTSEERLRALFEPYGEIGEVFLGPKSAFAFVKMDTRQNAEASRDALDCMQYEGRALRVRLASHAAAIRVKHLSPQVTNELLAYAFRYFGEIERAVVVVDDKGKSIGEGIVEYSKKQSAQYAIKRCQQENFMLTASPQPVLVEPYDQHDEDEGLPEKSINRNSIEYKEQRDIGPRFADQGSFEHSFGMKWKELYALEKQKRERLDQEIQEARQNLQNQIEYSRLEHDTMQLRNKLQELEDNRLKLQQMKEQSITGAQQRDELRRQQDLLIRQREDGILHRQQLSDTGAMMQQESLIRSQPHVMQEMLSNPDQVAEAVDTQTGQTHGLAVGEAMNQGSEYVYTSDQTMMNPMMGAAQMMTMNQPFMQMPVPMSMPNQTQAIFTGYIPPPPIQSSSMTDTSGVSYTQSYPTTTPNNQSIATSGTGRQQKFVRQSVNQGNNINVTPVSNNGRQRKRGRYDART